MKITKTLSTICLAALCCMTFFSCKNAGTGADEGRAKYIFVMIGDGMGATHVAATESYLSWQKGIGFGGEELVFTQFPVLGMCTTYSNDSNITDSAASGTAIATGYKTNNGRLGTDPDNNPLTSMAYTLKEAGYKVGIMSSVPVNHATPGAFYAHQENRTMYYDISLEIPQTDFEFFGGSGFLHFNGKNGDLEDIDKVLEAQGYTVCYGLKELAQCEDKDGVVVVQPGAKKEADNYDIEDGEKEEDRLGEVTAAAIEYLGDEEPFFMMVEGGEIDWAAHDNHTMHVIDAIVRFNEAVQAAYDFYLKHPDETLIIVTADHETGGMGLGAANGYNFNWTGLEEAYSDPAARHSQPENREISAKNNIGWTSSNHTATPVPVYAIGKGAEKFAGRIDNTEIYGKIVCE